VAKDLKFNITAQDDTSSVLAKIASNAKREMGKVDDALEDTRTAGQRAADALSSMFDEFDAELKQTARIADDLASKLGPELSSKVDTGQLIGEFRKLGLTLDEIEADTDALVQSIKRADDVVLSHFTGEVDQATTKVKELDDALDQVDGARLDDLDSSARKASGGLDRVRDSGDQSRSVMANMVGNSVQDLGALGGVAGTAGMAMGQLGEYAAEGNIKLRSLAAVAGPMALVGIAVAGISGHMKDIAEGKAFDKQQVKDFTEAIRDGGDAAKALAEQLTAAGEVKIKGPDWLGGDDLTDELAAVGVSIDQWSQLVTGSRAKLEEWGAAAKAAGIDADTVNVVMEQGRMAQGNWATATKNAAIMSEVFGTEAKAAGEATSFFGAAVSATTAIVADGTGAQDEMAAALEKATEKAERQRDMQKALADELTGMADAARDAADAQASADDASQDWNDTIADYSQAVQDAKGDQSELNSVMSAGRDSAVKMADATRDAFAAQVQANGGTLKASDGLGIWNGKMLEAARSAQGPLRDSIVNYIATTNGIPATKVTDILANPDYAEIGAANRALNNASEARTAYIRAEATNTGPVNSLLDSLTTKQRTAYIDAQVNIAKIKDKRARGGVVQPGEDVTLVGEEGPELVSLPAGSMVHTASQTRGLLAGASSGAPVAAAAPAAGGTTNIFHIQVGAGAGQIDFERAVQQAMNRVNRNNGRG
jgi:hypothetical protein